MNWTQSQIDQFNERTANPVTVRPHRIDRTKLKEAIDTMNERKLMKDEEEYLGNGYDAELRNA